MGQDGLTDPSTLYLTDVSPSDKPWDVHRSAAAVVQSLYLGSELPQYGHRIGKCSEQLGFALEAKDSGEMKIRLRQARFCRVRHCPTCQWRKTLVWRARLISTLPKVVETYPKSRWLFLTLTVRNCPLSELRTTIAEMNGAWHRMVQRKQFPADGFLRSLEVTRNPETNEAHPHFHVLMMVPPSYFKGTNYLSQQRWGEMWQSCLRVNYLPVVHVQTVKNKQGSDMPLINGILETAKYGVKEEDLMFDSAWLQELTLQLHKTRSITVGGILKDYLKDDEPEDLINVDENNTDNAEENDALLLWFDWREQVRRYAKRG
jgi:plasmid rolling circle replication initiator protein Rep